MNFLCENMRKPQKNIFRCDFVENAITLQHKENRTTKHKNVILTYNITGRARKNYSIAKSENKAGKDGIKSNIANSVDRA